MEEASIKVSVRSIPKTFRRAGLQFTDLDKEYSVDAKTLAILKAEPMLVVIELPIEEREKEAKGGKK